MQTVLFHSTVFGPIHSRRLGVSLGINLMPDDGKICSFDCVYCEAGYDSQGQGTAGVSTKEEVKQLLEHKLRTMKSADEHLDVITFSGNGEPTLHPQFREIVHDVLHLRNKYFPEVKVTVLSNSSMLGKSTVVDALKDVDLNILKLDSAIPSTFRLINQPVNESYQPEGVVDRMKQFEGKLIIQTMMLRGEHDGQHFDNTTDEEVDALIAAYKEVNPQEVMIYSIDRPTPEKNIEKITKEELEKIGKRISDAGIKVQVNA
jgi:wyosine [tRNA(Phe)-imidazoG37] synthetase (radical SAM superfamily)